MYQFMFVFDYLLSMFAQYYMYPIDYDKTNSCGVVKGRSFPQKKKKNCVKILGGCEITAVDSKV